MFCVVIFIKHQRSFEPFVFCVVAVFIKNQRSFEPFVCFVLLFLLNISVLLNLLCVLWCFY